MSGPRRITARLLLSGLAVAAPAVTAAPAFGATAPADRAVTVLQRVTRVLRMGVAGPDVAALQRALGVPVDGVYGRGTAAAVRAFQLMHHLEVDGQAGPQTMAALVAEATGRPGDVVLSVGARGGSVSALQWVLGLPATARYTKRTGRAVRRYQAHHGLVADGQAGPDTLAALDLAAPAPATPASGARRAAPLPPPTVDLGPVGDGRAEVGRRAASVALTFLGTPYVWGGESPQGFDCSGLVQYAYERVGIDLPRVAADQYRAGPHVDPAQLMPGDLVFFEHLNHVGIYLGNGRFVHAPHTGTVVQISRLDGWYTDNFVGATRVW